MTCGKHLHDRGCVWDLNTRVTPPLFIEEPVSSQKNERF